MPERGLVASDGYQVNVVARLRELREGGMADFEWAWRLVMHELPAPWSWRPRPAYRGEAPLAFLKRQCRDAWTGEGPPLEIGELYDR